MSDAGEEGEGEEPPRADGDHVKDVDDLVDRRVGDAFVVLPVQAVRAGDQHPEWQRDEEEPYLDRQCERVPWNRLVEQQLGDDECGGEGDHVAAE